MARRVFFSSPSSTPSSSPSLPLFLASLFFTALAFGGVQVQAQNTTTTPTTTTTTTTTTTNPVVSCSGLSQANCIDNCVWKAATSTCVVNCLALAENAACVANSPGGGCAWLEDAFLCYRPGEPIPCDIIYDQATCLSNTCSFDENLAAPCYPKDAAPPCSGYSTNEAGCKANGCQWFVLADRSTTCLESNAEAPCSSYLNLTQCPPTRCWRRATSCENRADVACTTAQFELSPPTPTTLRVCRDISNCTLYQNFETKAATSTSDRVCTATTKCPSYQYWGTRPTLTSDGRCTNLTFCKQTEFEVVRATTTTDRECAYNLCIDNYMVCANSTCKPTRNSFTCECINNCKAASSSSSSATDTIIGIVIAGVIVLIICTIFFVMFMRRRSAAQKAAASAAAARQQQQQRGGALTQRSVDQILGTIEAGAFKPIIGRSRFAIHEAIGSGNFGIVHKATIIPLKETNGEKQLAMLKGLHPKASLKDEVDFLSEVAALQVLGPGNKHVVSMIGFCLDEKPYVLALELMANGNLRDYLRSTRATDKVAQTTTLADLLRFTREIAEGMSFLASKGLVHRDVAARNILLDKDMVCKVGELGIPRDVRADSIYGNARVPVLWMAPEVLVGQPCTTEADVWSFGVTLWEIFELGATPYVGAELKTLHADLQRGMRLKRPKLAPPSVYNHICTCFGWEPRSRPTFAALLVKLATAGTEEFYFATTEIDYAPIDDNDRNALRPANTAVTTLTLSNSGGWMGETEEMEMANMAGYDQALPKTVSNTEAAKFLWGSGMDVGTFILKEAESPEGAYEFFVMTDNNQVRRRKLYKDEKTKFFTIDGAPCGNATTLLDTLRFLRGKMRPALHINLLTEFPYRKDDEPAVIEDTNV